MSVRSSSGTAIARPTTAPAARRSFAPCSFFGMRLRSRLFQTILVALLFFEILGQVAVLAAVRLAAAYFKTVRIAGIKIGRPLATFGGAITAGPRSSATAPAARRTIGISMFG